MANISAAMVKELREMSGAGMMDCKKALTEADGNMNEAMEILRKSGAAKMEKKAGRIAAEGVAKIAVDGNKAVVVEVNSETDFVAKNELFQTFVQKVADKALTVSVAKAGDGDDLADILGVKADLEEATLKIGEKLSLRRFERVEGDCVSTYVHGGGRIGVLIAGSGDSSDAAKEALTNVAMQVAAMSPQFISRDDLSSEQLAKEKEITIDAALNDPASLPKPILQGLLAKAVDGVWSPEDVAVYEEQKNNKFLFNFLSEAAKAQLAGLAMDDKAAIMDNKIFSGLVEGRISKHLKEICLLDQIYVKDESGKQTVAQYLASVNKDLKIAKMVRYEVGEGIEKKQEDFAAEVAAQLA